MHTTVDWEAIADPANVQNRNAGNGADLVKHTVYLVLLRHLLAEEPWSKKLLLRKCHAVRSVYQIGPANAKLRMQA